jgi:hypothetical protein
MNPLRDLLDYMAKAPGAQALFTAGLLMAGFGVVALVARPDATPVYLLLTGTMAVSGLMALGTVWARGRRPATGTTPFDSGG